MAKKIIVAKFTHTNDSGQRKEYVGKRESKMYDETSKMSMEMVSHANAGLTLTVQREIRDALKVKHGIKTVTSGGEAKDLSAIEAV